MFPVFTNAAVVMPRVPLAACLFVSFVTSAGCGSDAPPAELIVPTEAVPEVLQRQWSQGNYVFRTAQSWSDAWYASPSLVIPETTPPQIDFSAKVLVGVAAGWGTNGCAGLAIRRAIEQETGILVEYSQSEGTPPPGAGCTAVMVQLVDFAKIPYTTKSVTFIRKDG